MCSRKTRADSQPTSVSQKTFRLEKNKEFPFEFVGYETARLKNGDRLTIKNYGCENYSLSFRFETSRFSGSVGDARIWYENAVRLIEPLIKNVPNEDLFASGTKALKSFIKNNRTLKFEDQIDFGGTDIQSVASVSRPRKLKNGKREITVSFGIGPL